MANCKASASTRRQALKIAAAAPALGLLGSLAAAKSDHIGARRLIAEAFRMRDEAVATGDQAYGAVVVLDGHIVGEGPSRVVTDRNSDAHAERVALWDAHRRLGRTDLSGAVIYSTSQPCAICQQALAKSRIARMYVGRDGTDAGPPRGVD